MVSLIGYAMVRENKHLPGEIYKEIMSYLIPRYLLNTPEINNYNKVVAAIPGFDIDITPKRIFSSATHSFKTVKFIYRLKRDFKNITSSRDSIAVHTPQLRDAPPFENEYIPPFENNYKEQYHIYHLLQSSPYQHEVRTRRDILKALYG
jgi:hypothetical protein